jgi:hypothetical protein
MRRAVAPALAVALLTGMAGTAAAHEPAPDARTDQARGVVELGLERATRPGPCGGYGFEFRAPTGAIACSHGPDPAPYGIDVRQAPSLALHRTRLAAAQVTDASGETSGGGVAGAEPTTVPCVGYGTSGTRVQAVYASVSGTSSRYAEVAPLIQAWARQVDDVFDESAGQTAGSRHLRWVHDAGCTPMVVPVVLSSGSVDNLGTMMAELAAAGLDRADRRYLVWFDVEYACGVAVNIRDDSPDETNRNNGVPTGIVHFARVDAGCWGNPAPNLLVEAHEIMHTLGAVQFSSPNSSSVNVGGTWYVYGHCVDDYDTMCYADGTPRPLVYRCPEANERRFDCGHDDYFHTAPPPGSYLATHWNSAMSRFLVRVDPVGGFLDVDTSIFRDDVGWIRSAGITTGCTPNGEAYCADGLVTREQMASFLVRALGLAPTSTDFFTDDEASIHEPDINSLAASAIGTGCGGGRFCPGDVVSREQMASFLARARSLAAATQDYFTDDAGSLHQADINRVAQAGIASGCGGGRYCPAQPVTRGQMAAFLRRAFGS